MTTPAVQLLDDDDVRLRRTGVRFPIELRPAGFVADDVSTWPLAEGRLELVKGRLLYMPPCADIQQYVAVDLAFVLRDWASAHPGFLVGGNEAGMKLGGDVRAADGAVWSRTAVGAPSGRIQHVAPLLAAEVAGVDEDEDVLREKARWYLDHGVRAVWIILPESREVVVVRAEGESRYTADQTLPEAPELPGLRPGVAAFFTQL